jgi:hypothetical protein
LKAIPCWRISRTYTARHCAFRLMSLLDGVPDS